MKRAGWRDPIGSVHAPHAGRQDTQRHSALPQPDTAEGNKVSETVLSVVEAARRRGGYRPDDTAALLRAAGYAAQAVVGREPDLVGPAERAAIRSEPELPLEDTAEREKLDRHRCRDPPLGERGGVPDATERRMLMLDGGTGGCLPQVPCRSRRAKDPPEEKRV
jgi:hypothetical protein